LPVAKELIKGDKFWYNVGCVVPLEVLRGPNGQSLMKRLRWVPPGTVCVVQPVAAPEPAPPTPKPVPIFKEDWPSSVRATAAQPGCNPAMAEDLLALTPGGTRQNLHWQRVTAEKNAIANRTTGRRIAPHL
jgi:hypothetical protein